MTEAALRDQMCRFGKSLFDRGYAVGTAGNLSARLPDGNFLVTPTGSSLGRLEPDTLSKIDEEGRHLDGKRPTKESSFHLDLYRVRSTCGGIVHLHSTYTAALSCLSDLDLDNAIRPFTPYFVMRVGELPVVPYHRPGSLEIGRNLAALAQKRGHAKAFLLASHGPVILGADLENAVDNAEELEETARLWFLLRGEKVRYLGGDEINALRR